MLVLYDNRRINTFTRLQHIEYEESKEQEVHLENEIQPSHINSVEEEGNLKINPQSVTSDNSDQVYF